MSQVYYEEIMRKTNELIWHCSATPEGRHVTVKTIRKWHTDKGWADIGYHKVVYLDGSIHDGRPVNRMGAHVKGHNRASLGYCYIGGYALDGKTAKDTRTFPQKKAMARLTREAVEKYGVTKVTGHNEYANKDCPCFNVQTDPTIQGALRKLPVFVEPKKTTKTIPPGGIVAILAAIIAAIAAFLKSQGVW